VVETQLLPFQTNITNINPTDYTWVNDSSNYTLCHNAPGDPTQALLWLVGHIDRHSLEDATTYQNWTVEALLPAETDKALDRLLKTGPWKACAPLGPLISVQIRSTCDGCYSGRKAPVSA
jgi:hypothetical protein